MWRPLPNACAVISARLRMIYWIGTGRRRVNKMAEFKTNVMRMLDKDKVPYTPHTYDHGDGAIDGASVAARRRGRTPTARSRRWSHRARSKAISTCSSCRCAWPSWT